MFHAVKLSTSLNVTQHTWVIYMHLKGCRKLNTTDFTYCCVFPPDKLFSIGVGAITKIPHAP